MFSDVGTVLLGLTRATQEAEQLALNDPQSSGRKGVGSAGSITSMITFIKRLIEIHESCRLKFFFFNLSLVLFLSDQTGPDGV